MVHSTAQPSKRLATGGGVNDDDLCCKKKVSPQFLPVSHPPGDGLVDADNCETLNKMIPNALRIGANVYLSTCPPRRRLMNQEGSIPLLIKICATDAARCATVGLSVHHKTCPRTVVFLLEFFNVATCRFQIQTVEINSAKTCDCFR